MVKIAVIGAGSVVFTRRLLGDILSFPALSDSRIALMDIDAERLDFMARLASKMV
ncbi:MAG: alpha-glucosidase/alpha-galactosidase, partial [Chloroflexi bacterium]|nr:alpha-glucosidase/alpha-galactosidase [Chloroflexota bacterium]